MARQPEKSDGAFRTIREVADWLGVPTHVLRFWESKFDQIAPVKGAGGRRYYRPEDMRLLGGIKVMLHDQGLTIRAVGQKIDDDGTEPVMAMSPELERPEAASTRTRRVIRQGDAAPAKPAASKDSRVVPLHAKPAPAETEETAEPSPAPEIAKDAPTPAAELLPSQPDAPAEDALEAAPEPAAPTPEPPAPEPELTDKRPDTPEDLPSAPSDPTPSVAAPDDPAEPAEAEQTPVDPLAAPAFRALQLARASGGVAAADHRRLKRVIRRARALVEEITDDMEDAGGR